ncbi:hypothetical protein FXF51_03475 [Nonomuraea sp. PA05]|uniref:hypothetical protein n=1 Tax=Nonomuraea sp. PA05 TaxID=2604466 RepID=UPI0011D30DCB|nr:hypothetical protein [Nonomuraea sp. PA05]TYB70149.1 hypothetical protein FXF51_03475 [Nonomuraea sp. PA05]
MSVVLAVLGVVASIAGIVQTVVVIIERAERKRREARTATSERRRDSVSGRAVSRRKNAASPIEPPWNPDLVGSSWRSALAYLLGFVGGLIFRRDQRPDVRFHAVQSILIDIVAVVSFLVTLVLAGVYASTRYQGASAESLSDDVVMWTWALASILGPPALHLLLTVLTLTGRSPRVPLLWKVAATVTARPSEDAGRIPDLASPVLSRPLPRQSEGIDVAESASTAHAFDLVWDRIGRYEGEVFRLRRGGTFTYRLRDNDVCPDRAKISIHRSNFVRAWDRRPLSGPGQLSKDIIGPSYVYAILTDSRIATEEGSVVPHMSTELIAERPYESALHHGRRAAQGRCSWHGQTCEDSVVASVLTRDKGGETWHAVCQRALSALRGD